MIWLIWIGIWLIILGLIIFGVGIEVNLSDKMENKTGENIILKKLTNPPYGFNVNGKMVESIDILVAEDENVK